MVETITRKDIRKLSTPELDNLVKAFAAIQNLDPDDPDSFFSIAGLHGEPFRGAGYGNPSWWGGYCNHGNVLFPTWHRAYLLRLEQALQKQVPGVALPYWNETEDTTNRPDAIPAIFLQRKYTFDKDKTTIDNPLFSYKFQRSVVDRLAPIPDANYTKPKDYRTVRYPFSGLVGTDEDKEKTRIHNARLDKMGEDETDKILNDNLKMWLNLDHYESSDGKLHAAGVRKKFIDCLNAPNYTVFSNTTSAQRWNDDHSDTIGAVTIVPLESPHNSIHLALGGFDVPKPEQGPKPTNFGNYPYANGDMGENDTASFDPIFYFHHCFIDLTFWKWQVLHSKTESLDIIEGYPGTNSVDNQGPTPGVAGGTWLTMDSPLSPFKRPDDTGITLTSNDVVDIAKLGYAYEGVSRDGGSHSGFVSAPPSRDPAPVLTVSNISRAGTRGSFLISTWAVKDGKKILVGTEPILSRWHVSGCQNCQTHLEVRAHVPLQGWIKKDTKAADFDVRVHSRNDSGEKITVGYGRDEDAALKPVWEISYGHLR